MATLNDITAEILRANLSYDPETGVFRWRLKAAGKIAGSSDKQGYIVIGFKNKPYKAHRLAWLHMTGEWPTHQIDHIDRNPANNRWVNLREATHGQNRANSTVGSRTESGLKGVYRVREYRGAWKASIRVNGKLILLGIRHSPEEAHALYLEAARRYFGEFARGG